MKEREKAYNYFEKALQMEGNNYKAYICYAIALSEFGEYDMAVAMYEKAQNVMPAEIEAQVLRANLYTNFNHLDLAMDLYKQLD